MAWKCGCPLDKNLVEYIERLPAEFKVRNGTGKWLHRRVSRNLLPKNILRRKKRGFAVNVVDDWFRSALNNHLNDLLLDGRSQLYEFLDPAAVREMLKEHHSGRCDNHKVLFSLVVLEVWLREFRSLAVSGCSV